MQDLLFWVVVLGVMVWLGRRRRPPPDRDIPETIQSYRLMEGGALPALVAAHPRLRWRVLSLEELPTQHRRRLILHIAVEQPLPPAASLERLLWSLAAGLQRKAKAHAVVVEAFAAGEGAGEGAGAAQVSAGGGVLRLLLSLDGHGWSGQAPLVACMEARGAAARVFTVGQLHRLLSPPRAGAEGGGTLDGVTAGG